MNKAQLEKKADANINLRILIYAGIGIIVFGILYSIGVIDYSFYRDLSDL